MKKYLITLGIIVIGIVSYNSFVFADDIQSGLVGWWTFDGKDTNWNTNKTNDLSGNGNIGTMTNMSTSTAPVGGKVGQGLKFDGTASQAKGVNVINSGILNFGATTNFSISLWFNTTLTTAEYFIFKGDLLAGQAVYTIRIGDLAAGKVDARISDGTNSIVVPSTGVGVATKNDGKWHHAVVTFIRTGNAQMYIDGSTYGSPVNISSVGNIDNSTYTNLSIGRGRTYNGVFNYQFNGSLDDLRVYNRALSATEIQILYRYGLSNRNFNFMK